MSSKSCIECSTLHSGKTLRCHLCRSTKTCVKCHVRISQKSTWCHKCKEQPQAHYDTYTEFVCTMCKISKSVDAFHQKGSGRGHATQCKVCLYSKTKIRLGVGSSRKVSSDVAVSRLASVGCVPLEPYPGSVDAHWMVACSTCKHAHLKKIKGIMKGQGCPKCGAIKSSNSRSIPEKIAVSIMLEKGIEPLEIYPGVASKKWKCRCTKCGKAIEPSLGSVRQGFGCRFCGAERRGKAKRGTGKGSINHQGYKVLAIWGYRGTNDTGYVLEHRHVVEEAIGRRLSLCENVHHKNGDRLDNRIENLEIWNTSQPPGQRIPDKVAWAKELLALYEPEALA